MKNGLNIPALLILPALCLTPAVLMAGAAPTMSFFVTSVGPGKGADLGGLAGADRHCQSLAQAKGAGNRTWRAYLSTTAKQGAPAVNAKDRIGRGPWYNAKGVLIAQNVAELHSEKAKGVTEENIMTEAGGRPSRHDMLTGSQLDGTAFPPGEDRTCANWTSSGEGRPWVGHSDLKARGVPPSPFNSAHASAGCSPPALQSTGGDGLFYCFAAD